MSDRVQARGPLVIRPDDVPRRERRIGLLEHDITRAGVVVPTLPGGQVHRTQLPLPERIRGTGLEAPLLLVVADFHPQLDEDHAPGDQELLALWAHLEEALA